MRALSVMFAAAATLSTLGCLGSSMEATVSGTVTLDGNPVGPGVVTFAPQSGTAQPAVGELKKDGGYFLTTSKQKGLAVGSYRVSIQAFQPPGGLAEGERSMKPSVALVPKKYMDVATSGLTFDVQSGSNTIDIPLTSQ